MSEKLYGKDTEFNDSSEITKNILSKDNLRLTDYNIHEIPKKLYEQIIKYLSIITYKAKISQIKKASKWSKFYLRNKRNNLLKERINKNNLIDYWISSNIFTNNNININELYLQEVFTNYENLLLDEYETNIIRNFYNNPENILKFYFIKDQQNTQNNNSNNNSIINNEIIIHVKEIFVFSDPYENLTELWKI